MSERIQLGDDGTMDTVLVCNECGQEARYNYDPDNPGSDVIGFEQDEPGGYWRIVIDGMAGKTGYTSRSAAEDAHSEEAYNAFIEWAIEDFDSEHECEETE